jgi:hypothetical protein
MPESPTTEPTMPTTPRPHVTQRDANIARIASRTAHNALTAATVENHYGLTPTQFDEMCSELRGFIQHHLQSVDFRVTASELPADDPARLVEPRQPRTLPATTTRI